MWVVTTERTRNELASSVNYKGITNIWNEKQIN